MSLTKSFSSAAIFLLDFLHSFWLNLAFLLYPPAFRLGLKSNTPYQWFYDDFYVQIFVLTLCSSLSNYYEPWPGEPHRSLGPRSQLLNDPMMAALQWFHHWRLWLFFNKENWVRELIWIGYCPTSRSRWGRASPPTRRQDWGRHQFLKLPPLCSGLPTQQASSSGQHYTEWLTSVVDQAVVQSVIADLLPIHACSCHCPDGCLPPVVGLLRFSWWWWWWCDHDKKRDYVLSPRCGSSGSHCWSSSRRRAGLLHGRGLLHSFGPRTVYCTRVHLGILGYNLIFKNL